MIRCRSTGAAGTTRAPGPSPAPCARPVAGRGRHAGGSGMQHRTILAAALLVPAAAAPAGAQRVTERVSVGADGRQADGYSYAAGISADGRHVAFVSSATNLVPGDTNGESCGTVLNPSCPDVFVHDRATGRTERVSVGPGGRQADGPSYDPGVSAGGRVVFESDATNLVPGDTNRADDVFVRRRQVP